MTEDASTTPVDPHPVDPHPVDLHPVDLHPAAERTARVVAAVPEELLDAPTPCAGLTVADLLEHVGGLAPAFTAAARKDLGPLTDTPPGGGPTGLPEGWRAQVPDRLRVLADAWAAPSAWRGATRAGGVDLGAGEAGLVALDELVLHGWDLAVATGQPYGVDPVDLAAVRAFVESVPADPAARAGLFGPPVPVPAGAPEFDLVLGLAGRDPAWRPPAA
ncbi:TIGR03086 family metal-binding protein [Paenibacillus sp. TRM 82003]|uniref:TIGR03086 family metal-binding protein n=1 Tax=Kineococcus sp. TRM81007 TaxID=2925831 RepID=UPI001F5AA3BC|nr:TIGR03086 family metal-binding protein [Kineococcus sp. TRM81007]MCI2239478.1 TIGR03086 family metal-binding protein [Kineococcus sp. TRM81007]MCI3919278.1 TIGR03086 family metal-binding protein [Paenibacillus sp. TRM 82003]